MNKEYTDKELRDIYVNAIKEAIKKDTAIEVIDELIDEANRIIATVLSEHGRFSSQYRDSAIILDAYIEVKTKLEGRL